MSTNRPSTLGNLSAYLLVQALHLAVPFITVPIFTRLISPEHYGVLDMLQIVLVAGLGLSNWGLLNAFDRYYFAYADSPRKQMRLLGTLAVFSAGCLGAVLAALLLLRHTLSQHLTGTADWSALLLVVFASGALNQVNTFFLSFLKNAERAVTYTWYDAARVVLSTALGLGAVAWLGYGIWGLTVSQLVAQSVVFAALIVRFGLRRMRFDLGILRECLGYSWPLGAMALFSILNTTADKYLVGKIFSLSALAVYGRAATLATVVFTLMTITQNTYAPKWSKVLFDTPDRPQRTLGSLFTEYVAIIVVPTALLVLFCREAVGLILPEVYREAIPLVIGLSLYYGVLAFGKLLGAVAAYLRMSKFVAVVNAASAVILVGLNVLLIPRFGAAGAVLSLGLIAVATTVLSIVVYERRRPVGYEIGRLAVLYGGLVACAGVALATFHERVPYWAGLGLRSALGVCFGAAWVAVVGAGRLRSVAAEALRSVGLGRRRPAADAGEARP